MMFISFGRCCPNILSACCISIHICGQVVVFFVVATTGRAQLRLSNAVQRRHDNGVNFFMQTLSFDNQLHIRALSFCAQVLFRSCIVIGPVTLGQAAAFFVVDRLESSTNSPRFVP